MPKKQEIEESKKEDDYDKIISAPIVSEMKKSYLDYAMSVITARALPDVRDGLKPVHRRILYTMHELGLNASAKTRKSAKIVGDVTGNYHPHGTVSVYDALVNMAQPFTLRYPLAIGQGNFGSLDGDKAAADRYTEAKMSKISSFLLQDIDKETVNFRPNYENTRNEPIVLPAGVPNLLLNGTLGIAVGMASNIPPHNLGEVVDATVHMLDNPKATNDDLLEHVKGPDFPIGGIIFNQKDIQAAYANGRGGVVCRGEAEIVEQKNGSFDIVITSIPFRVNKADLLQKIAELHRDKKVEGIKALRDESTDDVRIVIEIKSSAHPQNVLNSIYKHTSLESAFHFNMVALVDGIPQTLSLKNILENFIVHRFEVITRRTQYALRKAEAREHILEGLKKALDHIDEIIKLIKKSKDTPEAHANLMKKFKFSEIQATAILEMKLQKLAGLERKKIEDELAEIKKLIKSLKELLASKSKMKALIKEEITEIKDKFADPRRTKVVKGGIKNISTEDLIPDEDSILVLTKGGYIKRTNPDEYKKQRRGGVGVVDLNTKEEDVIHTFLKASTHNDLLFFTDKGKVYKLKMYDIPEGKRATRGKSIMNFLSMEQDERVTSVLAMPKEIKETDLSVMMITRNGMVKRVNAENFHDVRRSGIIAIGLKDDDRLKEVLFVENSDETILVSSSGQSIRFKVTDVREMGRGAGGVTGFKLKKKDIIVGAGKISSSMTDPKLLVFSELGYGKTTPISEYKVQKRAGSGIKTANVTEKIGNLIAAAVVTEDQEEVVAISKKSQVIRVDIKEIPVLGRQTQGVKVMKMRAGDSIASLVTL